MKNIGSITLIIKNKEGLYEGNLVSYFKTLVSKSKNLLAPYHNLRHILHVLWLCYDACDYYRNKLTSREMRNLLIAALWHDFDHTGRSDFDDLEIKRSIRMLHKYIQPADKSHIAEIEHLIWATEFPHKEMVLSLSAKILRDADLCQAFSTVWIQQVIFGLANESGKSPLELLDFQEQFLSRKFDTKWAKDKFPAEVIQAKIQEAKELHEILA